MRTVMGMDGISEVCVRGRRLRTTAAFRSYWHVAAERQRMFYRRVRGDVPPWTTDPVLSSYRFTNAYRASDRVSQFLINRVVYGADADERSTVLRTLLFKIFNRIDTWETIEAELGHVSCDSFDAPRITALLDLRLAAKKRIYSAAYIMPIPSLGAVRKHANHLALLSQLLADGTIDALLRSKSLSELYQQLAGVPSFGPFLAFQFAIDLNYSELFQFSEMDFVVAGPGARDGVRKCFVDPCGVSDEDIIRAVTEAATELAQAAEVEFEDLWGRPLQLVDCQNLFCEVDKYSRVRHPELRGLRSRARVKQRYVPSPDELNVGYPPKWAKGTGASGMPLAPVATSEVISAVGQAAR